jgi:hypothetical protein
MICVLKWIPLKPKLMENIAMIWRVKAMRVLTQQNNDMGIFRMKLCCLIQLDSTKSLVSY